MEGLAILALGTGALALFLWGMNALENAIYKDVGYTGRPSGTGDSRTSSHKADTTEADADRPKKAKATSAETAQFDTDSRKSSHNNADTSAADSAQTQFDTDAGWHNNYHHDHSSPF